MGKDKIRRFAENATFRCVVQPGFEEVFRKDYALKGKWNRDFFGNDRPIVLELGCGRGEYTVALGERFPERNFIGVDVKGARLWRGAKTATENGMKNVAFLRTRIEFIDSCFAPGEVDEIWITFPDPQLNKNRIKKRLTAPQFLAMYARFLREGGMINLKTDSVHLHEYTKIWPGATDFRSPPLRRYLRDGIRRRGAVDQNHLRTAFFAGRAADHLPAFRVRRPPGVPRRFLLLPTKRCCRPELPYSGNSLIIYYPGRSCRDALFRICGAGIGTIIEFTETVRGRVCPKPI